MKSTAHEIAGDRIIDPMIDLSGCSKTDRILIVGSKALELMLEMQWREVANEHLRALPER
jgi:hypothetical protein